MKFRKGTYDDVNSIYQSLSDEDKEYVTPGRRVYKDVPKNLAARQVAYDDDLPVGFVDIYGPYEESRILRIPWAKDKPKPGYYTVETAVRESHRGKGISSEMAKRAVKKVLAQIVKNREEAKARGFQLPIPGEPDKIKWNFLNGNDKSEKAAIRAGFERKGRNRYEFAIPKEAGMAKTLRSDKEMIAEYLSFLVNKKLEFSDGSYEDAKAVYESLPDSDKEFVTPGRREYRDARGNLAARTVAYDNKVPVGVADLYGPCVIDRKGAKPYYNVWTAVSPDHRGKHLSPDLVKESIRKLVRRLRSEGTLAQNAAPRVEWHFLEGNERSRHAAINAGFVRKGRNRYEFAIPKEAGVAKQAQAGRLGGRDAALREELTKVNRRGRQTPRSADLPIFHENEDDRDFRRNIVIPMKQKHGGKPGVDYDDTYYRFDSPQIIAYEKDQDDVKGYADTQTKKIYINTPAYYRKIKRLKGEEILLNNSKKYYSTSNSQYDQEAIDSIEHALKKNKKKYDSLLEPINDMHAVLQHEVGHRDSFGGRSSDVLTLPGLSSSDKEKLHSAYKFNESVYFPLYGLGYLRSNADDAIEEISTNREFQYDIFRELKTKLGRAPDLKEFQSYISNMSEDDVLSRIKKYTGGYWAERYRRNKEVNIEDMKRAWREVARANPHMQNSASQMAQTIKPKRMTVKQASHHVLAGFERKGRNRYEFAICPRDQMHKYAQQEASAKLYFDPRDGRYHKDKPVPTWRDYLLYLTNAMPDALSDRQIKELDDRVPLDTLREEGYFPEGVKVTTDDIANCPSVPGVRSFINAYVPDEKTIQLAADDYGNVDRSAAAHEAGHSFQKTRNGR